MAEVLGRKGHRLIVKGLEKAQGNITEEMLRDFIDIIYRWKDVEFNIYVFSSASEMRKHWGDKRIKNTTLGEHRSNSISNIHHISFVHENIKKHVDKDSPFPAGNTFSAKTISMGYVMTLIHELTHANQKQHHADGDQFFTKKGYWNRACEREARQNVDDNINEICAYLNEDLPRRHKKKIDDADELEAVVDILCECEEITMDDIRDELRFSKILNPKNVQLVIEKINDRFVYSEEP